MRESTGESHVRSIELLGTLEQDADVGVVRVPPSLMRKLGDDTASCECAS